MDTQAPARAPRTMLEALVRERRMTFEEFVDYVERFAREHGEPGTLSVRHLQRLAAGSPLGPPRPATARLLERIFGRSINEILGPTGAEPEAPLALKVAVAIVMRDDRVLMVRRRADGRSGLSWQFSAGIVKPAARVDDVVVDETLAETGIHCVPSRHLGSRVHPLTNVICEFVLCEHIAGEAANGDAAENASVLWIPRADVTRLIPSDQIFEPILDVLVESSSTAT